MLYAFQIAGIYIIRVLIKNAAHLIAPKQPTPTPKPVRTVNIIRPATSEEGRVSKGKTKQRKIRCDIYLPRGKSDDAATKTKLPVVVNMHGSGFTLNTMGDDARFCQYAADAMPCVVVDVSYSKAPELPFPEANLDLDAVLAWMQSDHPESAALITQETTPLDAFRRTDSSVDDVKIDPSRVALTGFSSGGNLALTACVRAHDRQRLDRIAAVVSFYPSTNLAESPWKKPQVKPDKGAAGGVLPPPLRHFFYKCYVNESKYSAGGPTLPPRSSPLISPLYADAECFPHSTTIITCSGDSLAREGRQMAEHIVAGRRHPGEPMDKIAVAGARCDPPQGGVADVVRVPVEHNLEQNGVLWWEAAGQGHAWDKMTKPDTHPQQLRDEAYKLAVDRIRTAFAS